MAAAIEHTLLKLGSSPTAIEHLCAEASTHRFAAVCVYPLAVSRAAQLLRGSQTRVVSVVAFPHGETFAGTAADEAERCIEAGADELDMVIPLGRARAGELDEVGAHVREVRRAAGDAVLKVILETGLFDHDLLRALTETCIAAGADYLKTSTGFGPRGATLDDVALLRDAAKGRAAIKASGGIRDAAYALKLLDAGASRLGTSSGVDLVKGSGGSESY